jgi:hypothetical protein
MKSIYSNSDQCTNKYYSYIPYPVNRFYTAVGFKVKLYFIIGICVSRFSYNLDTVQLIPSYNYIIT